MSRLLLLKSSVNGQQSQTTQLITHFYDVWKTRFSENNITVRDLVADALPILDEQLYSAYYAVPPEQMTAEQKAAIAVSDALIAEIKAHDVIVMAAPMYNFTIPGQLKNYFDLLIRAGLTFSYTPQGRTGLVTGKKAVILSSSGGIYENGVNDFGVPYLKVILDFIGIPDVDVIGVDGVAQAPDAVAEKQAAAGDAITQFVRNYR